MKMGHQVPLRRRRYNIHPIQRTYFSFFLVPMLFFAFFLILLAFLPLRSASEGYVPILQDFRVWLAILISMIASGLVSYFVTNKFAGPVYRIEQTLRRFKEGDFPASVRVRTDDDLQELVQLLDGTFKRFASALLAINEQQALAVNELAAVQAKAKAGANGEVLAGLEEIGRNLKEVENILANFKVPVPQAPDPKPSE
jgi:methyl-accepting chemotaxis protein